jgi:AcrR family transcriptional regulator
MMTAIAGSLSRQRQDAEDTLTNDLGSVKIRGYDGPMHRDTYHHGDLKAVILAKAATLVAGRGADGISLRELAREAGVSHAAPAHHFADRRGLFTALAAQGWRLLADALAGARPDFIEAALAYVRFALDHPGHYAVMFDRSLVNPDDPELAAAQDAAGAELAHGVGTLKDPRAKADPESAALAAWSLVHGFAMLRLNEAIDTDDDPMAAVEKIALMLFDVNVRA